LRKCDHNIVFYITTPIFSLKIGEITENCAHNFDPWSPGCSSGCGALLCSGACPFKARHNTLECQLMKSGQPRDRFMIFQIFSSKKIGKKFAFLTPNKAKL
jgi:hypothetical protein